MTQHPLPCSTGIGNKTSCFLEENRNISNRYPIKYTLEKLSYFLSIFLLVQ